MLLVVLTALGIILADQATKWCVVMHLAPLGAIELIPGIFHLTFIRNTGIAFGWFQGHPFAMVLINTGCVLGLLFAVKWFQQKQRLEQIAYGMIVGGAIGNWLDRLRHEAVIDFLDFRVWPVFNIADTFITIGVGLMILLIIRKR
jgi:signal peptidase II